MDPRGTARFCGSCSKLVHDLSAMTEQEARALLSQTTEQLCVRYLYDAAGEIWFEPTRAALVDARALTKKGRRSLAAGAVAAVPMLFQACGGANSMSYDAGGGAWSAAGASAITLGGAQNAGAGASSTAGVAAGGTQSADAPDEGGMGGSE